MSNLKDQLIRLGNNNPELREHIKPVLRSVVASSARVGKERIAMVDRLRRRTMNASGRDWPVPPDADGSVPEEHGRPYESWDRWQEALEEYVLDQAKDIQAGSKSLYDRMTYPAASEPEWGIMEFDFRGWTLRLFVEGWMTSARNDLDETLFYEKAINPHTIETSLRKLATDIHRALESV
jgi:hypothetical protein